MTPTEKQYAAQCLEELATAMEHLKRAREFAVAAGLKHTRIPQPSNVHEAMQRISAYMQGVGDVRKVVPK
jgi:hypothetical protein